MVSFTHIDTACVLLSINGFKILTDPTLDNAGHLYYHGYGGISRKTDNPALHPDELGAIDLVLLSHHQHKDNFDINGRKLAESVPLVLSTKNAARELSNSVGLDNWETYTVNTPKVPGLKITATPAQHHPSWVPGFLAGKVIGFIIEYSGQANGVIYISGDTIYFKGIEEVAKRYKIDIAILHAGSVQFRYLTGYGKYTMNAKDLLKAVDVLDPQTIIPIHFRGWSHFKEGEMTLREMIDSAPSVNQRTIIPVPGKTIFIPF